MLKDIVEVQPQEGGQLFVRFEDGTSGMFDVARTVPFDGVFLPLRDPAEFARATVNRELGTVVWPCGADLDPDVIYAHLTGIPLPGPRTPING